MVASGIEVQYHVKFMQYVYFSFSVIIQKISLRKGGLKQTAICDGRNISQYWPFPIHYLKPCLEP